MIFRFCVGKRIGLLQGSVFSCFLSSSSSARCSSRRHESSVAYGKRFRINDEVVDRWSHLVHDAQLHTLRAERSAHPTEAVTVIEHTCLASFLKSYPTVEKFNQRPREEKEVKEEEKKEVNEKEKEPPKQSRKESGLMQMGPIKKEKTEGMPAWLKEMQPDVWEERSKEGWKPLE